MRLSSLGSHPAPFSSEVWSPEENQQRKRGTTEKYRLNENRTQDYSKVLPSLQFPPTAQS